MIAYGAMLLLTLTIAFISNNESLVRRFNLKLGLVPTSNVFKDTLSYWIVLTIICGISYLRGMIV